MSAYVELHTASAFSFLQGASLPEAIVDRAAERRFRLARDLRVRLKMFVVTCSWFSPGLPEGLFPASEVEHGIHGGAVETSIMLAKYPQHVRKDAIADFKPASIQIEQDHRLLSTQRAPGRWPSA